MKKESMTRGPNNLLPASRKPQVPTPSTRPVHASTVSSSSVPYRGTVRSTINDPLPVNVAPKAQPKKGSYAEIMARAKASQTVPAPVGVIKHKPKEKLSSKKEILLQKRCLSAQSKSGLVNPSHQATPESKSDSPGSTVLANKKSNKDEGIKGKNGQLKYKGTGTLKPQPAYKGTMKPVLSTTPKTRKKPHEEIDRNRSRSSSIGHGAISKHRKRNDVSDENESDVEEEEEEEDYGSDLSDMEADFSDVEKEDEQALKAAKRDDAFEAKMEVEMKRQKEERRKRALQQAKLGQRR